MFVCCCCSCFSVKQKLKNGFRHSVVFYSIFTGKKNEQRNLFSHFSICRRETKTKDLEPLTAKYVHQAWQKEWDEAVVVSYKFDEILSKLSDKLSPVCKTEKEDTTLNRLYDYWLFLLHAFLPFEKKVSCLCCMSNIY